MSNTVEVKVQREHGIAMHHPISGKYWHYTTPPGFTLPLVVHAQEGMTEEENNMAALEHFQGVMARRCPPPCMMGALNAMFSSIVSLQEEYQLPEPPRTRLHVLLGDPGVGKTELANVLSDALGWDAFVVPPGSGGNNLDELIKETRFGDTSAVNIVEKINRALVDAKENLPLISTLQKNDLIDEEYHSATGKFRLDVNKIPHEVEEFRQKLGVAEQLVAPETNSNQSPITYRPGRLLEKLIEVKETGTPTVVLIDEINRYENFGSLMQNLYEVSAGTRNQCTLVSVDEHGGPKDYTFTREDLKNVIIIGTGNIPDARKEPEARQLSDSLESRIGVKPLEMRFGPDDYAHRLCQEFLGFALSTYYEADRTRYEADPEAAAEYFSALRLKGTSEAQQKSLAQYRGIEQLLSQAGDVMEAAGYLGNVYHSLQELCEGRVDESSVRQELKQKQQLPPFGPRQIQNPLAQWAFTLPSNPHIEFDEVPSQTNLGTRMTNALVYWVEENFPKTPEDKFKTTRQHIGEILVRNHVIGVEEAMRRELIDGTNAELVRNESQGKKVADLINVGSEALRHEELLAAQSLLYDAAVRKWPQHKDAPADVLFNPAAIMAMLDAHRAELETAQQTPATEDSTAGFAQRFVPTIRKNEDGGFALALERTTPRLGSANGQPRVSTSEQLMAVIANMGGKNGTDVLADLFVPRPLSPAVEAELNNQPPAKKEAYRQKMQGINDGTHESGIHMTTIETIGFDGNPSGFTLLRDVQPEVPGQPSIPPRYSLIGKLPLNEEVVAYLDKMKVEYINSATEEGGTRLNVLASQLIETGAQRAFTAFAVAQNKPLEEITKSEEDNIIKQYRVAWERVLTGSGKLFDLSVEDYQKLFGKPLTVEQTKEIHEASPAEKGQKTLELGGGVYEAEKIKASGYKGTLKGVAAQLAFVLEHGDIQQQSVVVPVKEASTVARR